MPSAGLSLRKQNGALSVAEYNRLLKKKIDLIEALKERKKNLQETGNRYQQVRMQLECYEKLLRKDSIDAESLLVRNVVEYIVIEKYHMEIHFKCGPTWKEPYVTK